jgi:hypothetical protein
MVESEFVPLGTERDSGVPWALLAREQDGELEFDGPAILRPPSHTRAEWVHRDVDRETGIEGLAESEQDAVAQARNQGQGSAPQG